MYTAFTSQSRSAYLFILLWLFSPCVLSAQTQGSQTISVSLLIFSVEQRNAFENIAIEFNQQFPQYKIRYVSLNDSAYKAQVYDWLNASDSIDVLYWPWTSQLQQLYQSQFILPITDIWQQPNINQSLSSFYRSLVTVDQQQVAMPFSSGFWGFFYNKQVFERYNLRVPTTFAQLIDTCDQLAAEELTPILSGLKSYWPAAAWFEYINLRLNGLDFHQQTTRGSISFHSSQIAQVFQYWKQLLSHECFNDSPLQYELKDILPMLYRDRAAMILSGSFSITQFADKVRDNIGFFPFPVVNSGINQYEPLPTNVFIINAKSQNIEGAKAFLSFMAQENVQYTFNESVKYLPVNGQRLVSNNQLLRLGQYNVAQAIGFSQYYDRDTSQAFAEATIPIFAHFMADGDIQKAQDSLEKVRTRLFSSQ